jgi:hypothetical protein
LSLALFEKTELFQLFHDTPHQIEPEESANQLNLFDERWDTRGKWV